MYFDFGEGFNENDFVAGEAFVSPAGDFIVKFECMVNKFVKVLRFDPDDNKIGLSIKLFKIIINDGQIENYSSNAFEVVNGYHIFVTSDPYFIINQEISDLRVKVEIHGSAKNVEFISLQKYYNGVIGSCAWKITKSLHFVKEFIKKKLR